MVPSNTITPSAGVQQVIPDRLVPTPALGHAVETDLTPAKSVTAVAPAAPTRNDASRPSDFLQHTVLLDPGTQEFIYRVTDVRSRQVVRQIPDAALLRMRAYAQALNQGKSITAALNLANLEA